MMKKFFLYSLTAVLILAIALSGCGGGSGGGVTTYTPGQSTTYSVGGVSFNMNYVPGATFTSDDNAIANSVGPPYGSWFSTELTVTNSFWCANTEVTYELWNAVKTWATSSDRGTAVYSFANVGTKGSDNASEREPVANISWRDAIVWCNALTEYYNAKNGTNYACVYCTDSAYTQPLRQCDNTNNYIYSAATAEGHEGSEDNPYVNPAAKGFRLPYLAEWELAARYIGPTFPATIPADARIRTDAVAYNGIYWTPGNYASGAIDYASTPPTINSDLSATEAVAVFGAGQTATVKSKDPNALGLYDMSGNLSEWCFDWAPASYASGRISCGGNWMPFNVSGTDYSARIVQIGLIGNNYQWLSYVYSSGESSLGFRIVRSN